MNLQYAIMIHRYPDEKKRRNETLSSIVHGKPRDNEGPVQYPYCCSEMESAFKRGHITIAHDQRNFYVKYEERSKKLKEPAVCLKTFDEDHDYDSSLDEYNMPISFCPFCSEKITFELIEKKKITHTCKKIEKRYQECIDEKKVDIVFSKIEGEKS